MSITDDIVSVSRTIVRLPSSWPQRASRMIARPSVLRLRRAQRSVDVCAFRAAASSSFTPLNLIRWSMGKFFPLRVPFYLFASLYFQSLSLARNPSARCQTSARRSSGFVSSFLAWSLIYCWRMI